MPTRRKPGRSRTARCPVLAEDRSPCALGEGPRGDGAVGEVLAAHHVHRVPAGGAEKPNVQPEWGKAMARPDGVHGLQKRALGAAETPGVGHGGGRQEGETCQKSYENLLFSQHSRQSAVASRRLPPPKGVDRFRKERHSFGALSGRGRFRGG
jgi:hypothetical protein